MSYESIDSWDEFIYGSRLLLAIAWLLFKLLAFYTRRILSIRGAVTWTRNMCRRRCKVARYLVHYYRPYTRPLGLSNTHNDHNNYCTLSTLVLVKEARAPAEDLLTGGESWVELLCNNFVRDKRMRIIYDDQ